MPKNNFESTNFVNFEELFIILVGLMMTWFIEKMLIFNTCRRGWMPNLIKKSWTVSNYSKAFEEQPNEEESLKLFLEPDTEPMDADIIPSSQKEDIERSVSETSTPVLAKKLQNLGKNFDMEQLKETLSKKVSINFFLLFVFFDILTIKRKVVFRVR